MPSHLHELWPSWREEWVVHRDRALVCVDKPAGVPVHRASDGASDDLGARLGTWLGGARTWLMHGLDREASGLVVVALGAQAARPLAAELERGVSRRHLVAVEAPAARLRALGDRGPFRVTVSATRGGRALVELSSDARSQPVRRWLGEAGVPVAGDRDHRGPPAERLLWHVAALTLAHPVTGESLTLRADMPAAFARWLEADSTLPADRDEIERRLRAAAERRYSITRERDTDAFRLVHGAADALPGVEVDRYGDYLVVALASDEALGREDAVLDAAARLGARGAYLKRRPRQASRLGHTRPAAVAPAHALRGEDAPDPLLVRERGVAYPVRLGDGLSTGLFLDQRDGRVLVGRLAAGARVLNLFGYHGAFTVAAVQGGAASSLTIDASAAAVAQARAALAAQGAAAPAHRCLRADVLGWLAGAAHHDPGERFDLIVLDPPTFSTTKRAIFRVARDYERLAALALGRLAAGGRLLACTNHRALVPEWLVRVLGEAARGAGRRVARLSPLPDPIDFPAPPGRPCHLKRALVELAG